MFADPKDTTPPAASQLERTEDVGDPDELDDEDDFDEDLDDEDDEDDFDEDLDDEDDEDDFDEDLDDEGDGE